jgi:hypothetical protein
MSAWLLCPLGVAHALEPELTSDTSVQFYDVRSPTGENVISRRRLTTTLGVGAYDLYPSESAGTKRSGVRPYLTFRARLRYDADYGGLSAETDRESSRLVPGFSRGPFDLMYGYVEGRRFLGGVLGFKLGRQYVVDSLGWWSFDGGQVNVTTPFYLAAEVYGGLEQRGGMPLSTPRFEREGVWRGDRTGYGSNVYPSFQRNDVAPAFGAALESTGVSWLHGRLTYRRVYNTGISNESQFANGIRTPVSYEGTRISQERLGYGFDATLAHLGGVKGGLSYDLYNAKFANAYASLDAYVSRQLTLSLDYEYYVPTFDGDSIWNVFVAMPMNDLSLRAAYDPSDRLSFAAGARGRAFRVQTEAETDQRMASSPNGLAAANEYPTSSMDMMGGGDLSARWHFGEGALGARSSADFAKTGKRLGIDVYGERTLETRYFLNARAGVWQWDDKQRADQGSTTSFQYVAGVGYKLWERSRVFADFEHDMNRIAGHRFRAMLWLSMAVTK